MLSTRPRQSEEQLRLARRSRCRRPGQPARRTCSCSVCAPHRDQRRFRGLWKDEPAYLVVNAPARVTNAGDLSGGPVCGDEHRQYGSTAVYGVDMIYRQGGRRSCCISHSDSPPKPIRCTTCSCKTGRERLEHWQRRDQRERWRAWRRAFVWKVDPVSERDESDWR